MNLKKISAIDLKKILTQPLPGVDAQMMMAPPYRPAHTPAEIAAYNPKQSAVMVLFYPQNGEWHLVFTERKKYEGVHSGQMSFPGGKREENEDLALTALRETHEEVGVQSEKIELVSSLTDLYIPPSNFLVSPFAAISESPLDFVKQEKEVENVVEIPVSFFLFESSKSVTDIHLPNGQSFQVPAYIYNEKVIWGATAIILSEMSELIKRSGI